MARRFLAPLLFCVFVPAAFGQVARPALAGQIALCMNPSMRWIPIATYSGGQALPSDYRPKQVPLYGVAGTVQTPLKCDASGNLTSGGAASGDLSGSYPSPTVAKVNGGAVPLNVLLGTDATGKLVDASVAGRVVTIAGVFQVSGVNSSFKSNRMGGNTAATLAAGAGISASGTGYVAPACAGGHLCTPVNGTVTFTVGASGGAAGVLLTITDAVSAHTNQADCIGSLNLTAAPYTQVPVAFTYTLSVWSANVGAGLTASAGYTFSYVCMGN